MLNAAADQARKFLRHLALIFKSKKSYFSITNIHFLKTDIPFIIPNLLIFC